MLVKGIHLFSQSIFVCGMSLQQNSIWIFSDQLGLKLIFWLKVINAKELGICDFFVCIGDVEFLTVFTSNEISFDFFFSLDHIQQERLVYRQGLLKFPLFFRNMSQRAVEIYHGSIQL